MVNITNHWVNATQNDEMSPHTHYYGYYQKKKNKCCWRGETGILCTVGGEMTWGSCYENRMEAPQTIKRGITIRPSNCTSGSIPKIAEKAGRLKDTCTRTFTAALFTTARTWKQPESPSGWTEKQHGVHSYSGCQSAWKGKETLTHAATWMSPEEGMLSKEAGHKRTSHEWFHSHSTRTRKNPWAREQVMVARVRRGEQGVI